MALLARISKIWRERGPAGLARAGLDKLLGLPRRVVKRLIAPPGVFANSYTIVNNTRVTLYTDDPILFPQYAPRNSLCAYLDRRTVRVSLIAPVKEEAANAARWCAAIAQQIRPPDEIIVVDAGSQDGTREILQAYAASSRIPFRLVVEAGCNIARARNLAIAQAHYPVIAATDFGSMPRPDWLAKIVAPFEANGDTHVVAGLYVPMDRQHRLRWLGWSICPDLNRIDPQNFLPSNRSIAFSRQAWQAVGGYPEWLTLTGEDTWFDRELQRLGGEWAFVPEARVEWHAPENFGEYCRKVYSWARGDGESGLHARYYWRYVLHLGAFVGGSVLLLLLTLLGVTLPWGPDVFWIVFVVALWIAGVVAACRVTGVGPLVLLPEAFLEGVHLAGFLAGARGRNAALGRRLADTRGMFFILSGVPVDDTGGGARCTQIAHELLRQGFAVTFVHKFPKYEQAKLDLKIGHPNLFHYSLTEFQWAQFERRQEQCLSEKPLTAIVEFPLPEFLSMIEHLRVHHSVIVYDLLDDWDTCLGGDWYTRETEDAIIAASDVLVSTAPPLAERLQARSKRPVTHLPNAVNPSLFDPRRTYARPPDLPGGDRIVIYTGALWGEWFDWDLLVAIAEHDPATMVVVIGDYRGQRPCHPANLRFLGLKAQRDLPAYLAFADVGIIPWKIDAVTLATSPLKVYEYLAMGKPVVAPALEALEGIPGVYQARDQTQFVAQLDEATHRPFPSREVARFITANSWPCRVERLCELVEQARRGAYDERGLS